MTPQLNSPPGGWVAPSSGRSFLLPPEFIITDEEEEENVIRLLFPQVSISLGREEILYASGGSRGRPKEESELEFCG